MCVQPENYRAFADIQDDVGTYVMPQMVCYINNNTGTSFSNFSLYNSPFVCGYYENDNYDDDGNYCERDSIQMLDINADGNSDILYRRKDQGIGYFLNSGTGLYAGGTTGRCIESGGNAANYPIDKCNDGDNFDSISYADVTGDGMVDLCYRSDTGIRCIPGTGSGFDTAHMIETQLCANGIDGGCDSSSISFPDINGDGKADLSIVKSGEGIEMWLSTGQGFDYLGNHASCAILSGSLARKYQCDNTADNYHTVRFIDLNGDGQPDLSFRGDNGLHTFISNSASAKAPDMLTSITDGLGNQTTINYARLNDATASVYSEESCTVTPAYPEACINGPMYVSPTTPHPTVSVAAPPIVTSMPI